MKTGRLPRRLLACLTLVGVLLGLLAVPAWAGDSPTITSFSPTSGPVGTSVTINGTNFVDVTGVKFKTTAAVFTPVSPTKVTAPVPSGAATGKISVTTPDGTATSATDFVVTAPAAPTITSFSPTSGPVGTSVTINGSDFGGATSVKFGGAAATTFSVNTPGTRITATVPTGASTGKISVTTPSGTATSATDFVVTTSAAPTITSFSPTSGPVGTSVTITGSNFSGVTSVKFGSVAATSFSANPSGTQITATVPSGAVTGKITVTTAAGTATSTGNFTVTTAAPVITSFSPTSGPIGTSVAINGTGFAGTTQVRFNGVVASIFSVNSQGTRITATVPSGATTGRITVTTPSGRATSATDFKVTPKITSFSPTSGPVGTVVTITGSGFTGVNSVKFGSVGAGFTFNADTRITATVPTDATTGRISVTTPSGTGTSATKFTVTGAQAPTITSFSPTSGKAGTVVTITGTGFSGATSVRFGGVAATSFAVNSATQITATVPAGAVTGRISVTTPAGTGNSAANFTVLPTFHQRSISISLRRHLVVSGSVSVAGGFAACADNVPVRIQRLVRGVWRIIATILTNDEGAYRVRVADRSGRYRTLAPRETTGSDICGRAMSRVAINS